MHLAFKRSLVAAGALLVLAACGKKDASTLRAEPVTKGPIAEVVSATGGVEAIVTVNIGSQVSGTIDQLKVDFNSPVKKGQLLARIDPRPFDAAYAKSRAGVASAEANVAKAEAALSDAKRVEARSRELLGRTLVSQADVDTAMANREQAEAQLLSARAAVQQALADAKQSALNLEFTRIVSPVDGIVISRSIDVGQTVASAFQAPTLFIIANDLTKMRVLANIDEADVGKVVADQEVHFSVDSYPGEDFTGTIRQVRQAPNTINNVVTYAAEVAAPNPQRKLRQGMTAAVQVITARRASAVRVPNAALRWKPDDAPGGPPSGGAGSGSSDRRAGMRAANASQAGSGSGSGRARGDRNEVLDRPAFVEGEGEGRVRPAKTRMSKVYKLVNGQPVLANVRLGISDGHQTEVLDGLAEGDQVITGGTAGSGGGKSGGGGPRRGLF